MGQVLVYPSIFIFISKINQRSMDCPIKIDAINQINKFSNLDNTQIKNLEKFVTLLIEKNNHYNLIGKSTINNIWQRHILDSAQLLQFIDKNNKLADLGCGAGFPGLVLSILGVKDVHLIEKSYRKSQFLHQAREFSPNKISIHQSKLEELKNLEFDCITSRALAPLDKLLNYSQKFLKKDGNCFFLKGKNLNNELILAKKHFNFKYKLYPSLTSLESNIITISNITKIC